MDLLNNQMQGIPGVVATETLISLEQSIIAPGHKSGEIVHVRLGEYDGERVRAALC